MFSWLKREPKQLIERRQVLSAALIDYPLYQPPHRQGPNSLRRVMNQSEEDYLRQTREFVARSDQNFLYFMDQRATRLAALQGFLRKFGVSASLDDAGLASVSAWFPDNSYALVGNLRDPAVRQAFYQMQTPWTEERRGLNVIFDLGVFLGEALIAKQPRLHWKFFSGVSDHGESNGTGYHIEGFRRRKGNWLDPGQYILGSCMNDLNNLYSPGPISFRTDDLLVGKVRDFSTR